MIDAAAVGESSGLNNDGFSKVRISVTRNVTYLSIACCCGVILHTPGLMALLLAHLANDMLYCKTGIALVRLTIPGA